MRVIPLRNGPTLFVLETTDEELQMHICKCDKGEIVLYAEDARKIYSVDELDELINNPSPTPSWMIETFNKFIKTRNFSLEYY
jgi:hypothetical protein